MNEATQPSPATGLSPSLPTFSPASACGLTTLLSSGGYSLRHRGRGAVVKTRVQVVSSSLRKWPQKTLQPFELQGLQSGTPGGIRTPGLLIRSQTLYPAELRVPCAMRGAERRRLFKEVSRFSVGKSWECRILRLRRLQDPSVDATAPLL